VSKLITVVALKAHCEAIAITILIDRPIAVIIETIADIVCRKSRDTWL